VGLFNESQVARFNRQISRLHGIKGPGAPAPQVSPEIIHDVTLENDRFENRILGGTNSYMIHLGLSAPGAGLNGGSGLLNPTGSNVLAVLTAIGTSGSQVAASTFRWFLRAQSATGVTASQSIPGVDTRAGIVVSSAVRIETLANNGPLGTFAVLALQVPPAANGGAPNIVRPAGIVLAPGFELLGWNITTQNVGTEWLYEWYERALEPSEATFTP
jgi:hypothetical protein